MGWQYLLGGVILAVILLALYVQFLTQKHRSYISSRRHRRRDLFRPDWGRGRPDRARRRGIKIRRD